MANTVVVSRSHLIYGVCLPLAVLVGYLLAEPLESGSIAVVVMVLSVLSIPLLMRWHHPLLIFSCNALIYPMFVPGRPSFCMIMACVSFFFLMLNRSMGQHVPFFRARQVALSLIAMAVVTLATAYATGGIGFALFGSANAGGKRYVGIITAIFLYFGLSTITISRKYARLAAAVFFLSALTGLVGYLAAAGGSGFYFLVYLFPIEGAVDEVSGPGVELMTSSFVRLGSLTGAAVGLFCFVLARYGTRGVLDLARPWRLAFLVLAVLGNLYSGFRSNMISCALTFALMFCLEGLCRTRYFLALALSMILACAITVPYAQELPLVIQRTLAFLPLNIDPMVRMNAEDSTNWRLEMWQEVLPSVPKYLIKGKGYVVDPSDLYLAAQAAKGGYGRSYEGAMIAGDYHSGPLSVIVPFGLFGAFSFLWFLFASTKALYQNFRFGDPSLHTINTFLFAYFIVRIITFFFVFGSLYSDLAVFAGLVGLNVSLNGGVANAKEDSTELEGLEAAS
ncbi:MAG: O-Antigen ligase [Pedosphaera sp.]|nr:O-Antigen ligase [Pedosphaera sp.]